MSAEITSLLDSVIQGGGAAGLMSTFQSLPKEKQTALMEWARSMCIQLARYVEQASLAQATGSSAALNLPAAKIYVELALKIGIIRAIGTNNDDLLKGCDQAVRQVLGETKISAIENFKDTVRLALRLSKW